MYRTSQKKLEILTCISHNEPKYYGAENKNKKLNKHGLASIGEKEDCLYTYKVNSCLRRCISYLSQKRTGNLFWNQLSLEPDDYLEALEL